ncbi:N-acetylglucosamine kinase [Trueperella sp. LYQ141]|uniref:N-acetylglucosamine kinase n=1 Tax=Trueperella sp. LYQ141 TaxID=3391058 RepID=UPI00398303DB
MSQTIASERGVEVYLGADIGATSSKVVAVSKDGQVRAYARGAGGNIRSSGTRALDNIFDAIADVCAALPGATILGAHLGIAGAGPARWEHINAECQRRWEQLAAQINSQLATELNTGITNRLAVARESQTGGGITPKYHFDPIRISQDLDTAFAAASQSGNGILVLAGTGAVVAQYQNFSLTRRCDGMGWLLGDIGSATWIGIQALQAVAAALDGRGPQTLLTQEVLNHCLAIRCEQERYSDQGARKQANMPMGAGADAQDLRQDLIAYVDQVNPAEFGQFAPIVCEHVDDAVCVEIVSQAITGICRSVAAVCDTEVRNEDMVLTGGLLCEGGPLRDRLSAELLRRYPGLHLCDSVPPIVGALQLASEGHLDRTVLTAQIAEHTPFS